MTETNPFHILRAFILGQPGVKTRPRFDFKNKRTYTDKKSVNYETYLKQHLAEAMRRAGADKPFDGVIAVKATFFLQEPKSLPRYKQNKDMPHTKRPDLDNLLKMLLDAMNGIVVRDDSIIWRFEVGKIYSNSPGVEVLVIREDHLIPTQK